MEIENVGRLGDRIQEEMGKVIVNQRGALRAMLVGLLCEGHILFEGVPGTAKTLMVRTLAHVLKVDFSRIQFTPDLMPSDILGTNVFDLSKSEFRLHRGPIFTNLLLADEINRAPAKTQSALLESMQERRVTIDGVPHTLVDPFMVFATQNPVEHQGTYPLPEAQLDRFLLKVVIAYPEEADEVALLEKFHGGFDPRDLAALGVEGVAGPGEIAGCRRAAGGVTVEGSLFGYIREIARVTRTSPDLALGASPRAAVHLLKTSKASAALKGRGFVTPDDVKEMALPVLRHRLILEPEVEVQGVTTDEVIRSILQEVEVPR